MATGRTVPIWPCCVTLTLRPFQVRISVVATRNAIFPGTDGAAVKRCHRTSQEDCNFSHSPQNAAEAALVPTALLMADGGSQAAFASQAAATANVTSDIHSAPWPDSYYTMRLSPSPVTVRAGHRTRITISFQAATDLYGTPVTLSVRGLPGGVTASFSPSAAAIGGRSVLTLTAATSSAAGVSEATVTAMTLSSDPIGTSTPLGLTISAS
jgi:hypothetical protein